MYNNGAKQSASGAVFQITGSLVAHHSRHNPTFEVKKCRTFTPFTNHSCISSERAMSRLPSPRQALRQVGLSSCDPPFLLLGAPMRNQPLPRHNLGEEKGCCQQLYP